MTETPTLNSCGVGRLHLLTDTHTQHRFSHYDLFTMAVAAGVDVVQYREKEYTSAIHFSELLAISELERNKTRLIINDLFDVFVEINADGVHLGKEDLPVATAATYTTLHQKILGATVHFEAEYIAIKHLPVSYVGVGPVFGTRSKATGLPPLGLKGLEKLCKLIHFPVIAIGNIQLHQLRSVVNVGAYGVAVLSGFCAADDPYAAACALQTEINAVMANLSEI
jgi:thiamine-phosphate pyrophosphorylase